MAWDCALGRDRRRSETCRPAGPSLVACGLPHCLPPLTRHIRNACLCLPPRPCLLPPPWPCRNIFDAWLGTDNLGANLGSVAVGLAIILLFRLFKLPLAEFW